jgi:LysR family glycine cleavage system transcriptional activator
MAAIAERFPPLNALRAFEAAARLLSFKKAARELHVTPGAVSHQIKLLEEHLGVALFRRLTRALELTPEAQAMLPKVKEGLESLAQAVDRVRARRAIAALTVIAPPNFASRWLVPPLPRFTRAHPSLELHVASRSAMIDARENGSVPALPGGADAPVVMVRFGDGHYPGSRVDELFSALYVPVCSPKLLAGEHALREPADLRFHALLHDDTVVEEGVRPGWGDWLRSVGVEDVVDPARGPHFSDASLAVEAAIEGMGVALVLKPLVRAEIEAGRLAVPFDIAAPTSFAYYLVTPEANARNPHVEAFRAWLLEEVAPERN